MAAKARFGEFEFDIDTGTLTRRGGIEVPLQAQPARVLALLLEARGELVTREALRAGVWNDGTVVDFDRNINFCIAQIRGALGDSAESPRFIRTIPKRGYRFIAPVSLEPPSEAVPADTPAPSRRSWIAGVAAASVAAVAGGVALWLGRPHGDIRIAVVRFDNETDDPTLDRFADSVTDSLVAELASGLPGKFGVIGNAAALRGPREGRDIAAIATALGAKYVILGQVQTTATGRLLLAHLIRMPEQTHLKVCRLQSDLFDIAARRIAAEFAPKIASS